MATPYPNFPNPHLRTTQHVPAYSICPWKQVPDGLLFDKGTDGTGFFTSEKGIFITAKHVVDEYLQDDTPLRIMFFGLEEAKLYPVNRRTRLPPHTRHRS